MTDWLDRTLSVTDTLGSIAGGVLKFTETAGEVASFLNGIKLVARFVPGLSTAVAVLDVAQPILQKIALGAPLVRKAMEAGRPVIEAVRDNRAAIMEPVKELIALGMNSDPKAESDTIKAANISDGVAEKFAVSIFERSFFTPQDPRFDRVHIP